MFIVGILFIILTSSIVIYLNRSISIANTEIFLSAKKICNEMATSINQAASSNFGYRTTMNITDKLLGKNYTITVDANNREILFNWTSSSFICPISYQNVTNGTSSSFKIKSGKIYIQNNNGVVVIGNL